MTKIEATYRIVRPMFCSGADQTQAELRLPSFKGVLRFWWRALNYGRYASLAVLRETEDRLFGSTTGGQSRVLLGLEPPQISPDRIADQRYFRRNTWESYAGFGLTDEKERPVRQYISPGTSFRVRAVISRADPAEWSSLREALIMLGIVGGMGGRSRKGWGSLTLQWLQEEETETWSAPASREALREVANGLLAHRSEGAGFPPFTAVSSATRIVVGPEQRDAQSAHSWLADRYRAAVRAVPRDSKPEKEQFGLPRPRAGKNAGRRRASPLFLHVHQVEGGAAVPLAVFIPAAFLESQQRPAGGWRHVEAFLASVEEA